MFSLISLQQQPQCSIALIVFVGNLAELEEIRAMGRVSCESLLKQGVLSAKRYYNNMHVYPYTYQAGYYYRIARYKEAITAWANATDVIKQ